jgi:hypothetical protein
MTDTQRAAFEAWWREQMGQDCPAVLDGSREDTADMTWDAACKWQAAQAADAGREAVKYQWRDINGNWIDMPDGRMYRRLKTQGATVRALFDHPPIAAINDELVEALEACLAKGSRWHSCDPIVQQARAALSRAKEQK